MKESVSLKTRQARSRKMHNIAQKLLKLKKMKQSRMASGESLKKRAQRMARALLRKKMAGVDGGKYSKMSLAQRENIDRMLDRIPEKSVAELAKRLLPVVAKAERKRLDSLKKNKTANEDFVISIIEGNNIIESKFVDSLRQTIEENQINDFLETLI